MALFVIADTHLSEAVPKPMDVFGNRWQGYTEKLVNGWRAVVTEKDTVIVPGDISWGITLDEAKSDLRLLAALPGRKIIGRGNHDYWWQSAAKIHRFFEEEGIHNIDLLHHNAYFCENKILCGTRGWFADPKNAPDNADYQKIAERERLRMEMSLKEADLLRGESDTEMIAFFHFPPVFRDFCDNKLIKLMQDYRIRRCYFGHIHGNYDIPSAYHYEGIDYHLISADYLRFIPQLIV